MNGIEELVGKDWAVWMKDEFAQGYMIQLSAIIQKEREKYTVYPETTKEVFRVFKDTPYVNVIIIGQDPYHDGSYDGMAFSNAPWKKSISPSLRNIFKEVRDDVYDGKEIPQSPSLVRWQKQGVFLLNRVLTVRQGEPGSHRNIGWEIFTNRVIEVLSFNRKHLVFMLWGNEAAKIESSIQNKDDHLILKATHPSPTSANTLGGWFGSKHFSQANDYLLKHKLDFIEW